MEEVVNTEVTADVAPTDSTPVETTPEVADEFDGLGDVSLSNPVIEETEVEPESKAIESTDKDTIGTEASTQPQGKAEERKQQLNQDIRDLVSQRNAIRQEVEKLNAVYQPAAEKDLLEQVNPETGEYFTPIEAKVTSMQQRQQIDSYNNEVSEARLTLSSEAMRAIQDFPMFDENNKEEYNPAIAKQIDEILGANLIFDKNTNQVIGSRTSPYQLYKSYADVFNAAASKGQAKAQRATEKMLANVDKSSDTPSKGSSDPLEDLFSKIKDVRFTS